MEVHQAAARLKQGDVKGLEVLTRTYYLQAVRTAYLIVQDQALAEDVTQTSLVNLFTKIEQFDETREFRPWFLRIVVNNAISACRKLEKNISLDDDREYSETLAALERLSENGRGPEDDYISAENRQVVWQALEQLTPQQRAAVVLRYYLELSENEIEQELKRPKSTIKWALFSARRKLRQLLKPLHSDDDQPEVVPTNKERI
ncbi:MAG: hypothetical protein A2X25_02895 [Chloroflexi bacterium GWB2_49_20]|nr:MAG: hypothetical protein A2X25_02895 [Chloroflexi bacterium GWB2_49_20]OGN78752.1 MAG: hypothetical protein A2X26_12885 [Chloroflexi bacterium GWC2_49_37]OGN85878.1 MAG: hypothetical protein A2X27_11800 [Chloroflexi bacterium GWD2_49_16]